MVNPSPRRRQNVEDVFDSSESEQRYLTIDNDSYIPFTIYIKPSDNSTELLCSEVEAGKRFVYPLTTECYAAIEWFEKPELLAADVFVFCSLVSYILTMPFQILAKGVESLSSFDVILWTCILFITLYYYWKPRVRNPLLENRIPVENLSYRFYQKRSFTEGTLTDLLFFDIRQVPAQTST